MAAMGTGKGIKVGETYQTVGCKDGKQDEKQFKKKKTGTPNRDRHLYMYAPTSKDEAYS